MRSPPAEHARPTSTWSIASDEKSPPRPSGKPLLKCWVLAVEHGGNDARRVRLLIRYIEEFLIPTRKITVGGIPSKPIDERIRADMNWLPYRQSLECTPLRLDFLEPINLC
jgi:ubiquitin